ncbi:unnamed protein product [Mytilus coruscus]|uniref:Tyr recombinase domain-containing protein n=1 Tax=Mytilus coruscus TaxID=42192 RepID=A0A6J8AQY2_MYTCO|nr:unnamed protein product [Mytilus coruscus]
MLVEACQNIDSHEIHVTKEPVNPPQIQNDKNPKLPQIQNIQNCDTHQNTKQQTVTLKDQNTEDLDTADTHQAEFHQTGHLPIANTSRFKQLDDEALLDIEKNQYSEATKKNTKWGIGVFNGNLSMLLYKFAPMLTFPPNLPKFKVWYALAIHFVSRGIEFHQQLSKDSIKFENDEEGREYLTITHKTHQKNYQGGIGDSPEEAEDKRMYSTDSDSCPVQAVKLLLSKCHPNSKSLFNQCSRDALSSGNPNHYLVWYTETPVKVQFGYRDVTAFMPDICKNAGVKRYTAHSLRSTAITAMSDAGLTDRNIMYMSDHKCEESLKSYCRRPSNEQKQKISAVLDNVATGSAKVNFSCAK